MTRKTFAPPRTTALIAAALAGALGVTAIAGIAAAQGPGGRDAGGQLFEMFDADGDGTVTMAEVDQVRGERFIGADADGNGTLSLDEFETVWTEMMRGRMVDAYQRLDDNGDAAVTSEEFARPIDRMVGRLDTDGDGTITEDEIADLRERFHDRRGGGPRRFGHDG